MHEMSWNIGVLENWNAEESFQNSIIPSFHGSIIPRLPVSQQLFSQQLRPYRTTRLSFLDRNERVPK
jgi:hypothetical protein